MLAACLRLLFLVRAQRLVGALHTGCLRELWVLDLFTIDVGAAVFRLRLRAHCHGESKARVLE